MNWTELLKSEVAETYHATEGLLDLVDETMLDWKPESGGNWMTMGQLLKHLTTACGFCCRGFVTGDWGMPEGVDYEDVPEDEMLPPAEKMPSVETVEEARAALADDKALAYLMIERAGEEDLEHKKMPAPWNPTAERELGYHLLNMIGHLGSHKAQLFYYLKLLGKPVHTGNLWGM
jgi:hypothetical protein